MSRAMKHPIQPVAEDAHGILRFKRNAIVCYLFDSGPFDMNHLAVQDFSQEDREQFAQLIGYSLSGFGDLSYVSDETYEAAAAQQANPGTQATKQVPVSEAKQGAATHMQHAVAALIGQWANEYEVSRSELRPTFFTAFFPDLSVLPTTEVYCVRLRVGHLGKLVGYIRRDSGTFHWVRIQEPRFSEREMSLCAD